MEDQVAFISDIQSTESHWFSEPKAWFWAALVVGAVLRIYCAVFTGGTSDMEDWEDHARQVLNRGLIGYYHANEYANHPPFISKAESVLLGVADTTHIPFRILFRSLFAVVDMGNTALLFSLLGKNRWRFVAVASYWLSPAAIIISSYHGNTDSAIPFFVLLSVWFVHKGRIASGGLAFGASLWIKLTGVLAFPTMLVMFRHWRGRILFLSATTVTALLTYLPALVQDWRIVFTNVFGYRGLILQTSTGIPLWGPSVLLFSTFAPIQRWPENLLTPTSFLLEHTWAVAIAAIFFLNWRRWKKSSVPQVCATIGMAYAILFGFSDNWAFQYFAWGLPFWFFLPWWFSIPAVCLTSAYLYVLHWFFSGSATLLGAWNFTAHPNLPSGLLVLRTVSFLFFFLSAIFFLIQSLSRESQAEANREMPAVQP